MIAWSSPVCICMYVWYVTVCSPSKCACPLQFLRNGVHIVHKPMLASSAVWRRVSRLDRTHFSGAGRSTTKGCEVLLRCIRMYILYVIWKCGTLHRGLEIIPAPIPLGLRRLNCCTLVSHCIHFFGTFTLESLRHLCARLSLPFSALFPTKVPWVLWGYGTKANGPPESASGIRVQFFWH